VINGNDSASSAEYSRAAGSDGSGASSAPAMATSVSSGTSDGADGGAAAGSGGCVDNAAPHDMQKCDSASLIA
jgi:hypothetical protein